MKKICKNCKKQTELTFTEKLDNGFDEREIHEYNKNYICSDCESYIKTTYQYKLKQFTEGFGEIMGWIIGVIFTVGFAILFFYIAAHLLRAFVHFLIY